MKTYKPAIILLIVSMNVLGQNSYYWYKGEKIPLTETTNKGFILLEDENIVLKVFLLKQKLLPGK